MSPTLKEGQDVVSFNWSYLGNKPKVGDIVVIKVNGKEMVKRIQNVHDREVFVAGDNMIESTDSRQFGPIDIDQIVGKVVYSSDEVDCYQCGEDIKGIADRKDAICSNCGFKLSCCGEP